jgi:hypothetical protein
VFFFDHTVKEDVSETYDKVAEKVEVKGTASIDKAA